MTPEIQHAVNKAKLRARLEGNGGREPTDAEIEGFVMSDYKLLHPGKSDWELRKLYEHDRRSTVRGDVITVMTADLVRANRLLRHMGDRIRRLEMKLIKRGSGP